MVVVLVFLVVIPGVDNKCYFRMYNIFGNNVSISVNNSWDEGPKNRITEVTNNKKQTNRAVISECM